MRTLGIIKGFGHRRYISDLHFNRINKVDIFILFDKLRFAKYD